MQGEVKPGKDAGARLSPSVPRSQGAGLPLSMGSADRQPPPVPPPAEIDPDGFGSGDEDGLRMLAALEAMTSLEPDYSAESADDFSCEASVTIIEGSAAVVPARPFGLGRRAATSTASAGTPDNDQLMAAEDFKLGFVADDDEIVALGMLREEASIEIIYPDQRVNEVCGLTPMQAERPASLSERIAAVAGRSAGSRFIKALSGK